ncbi:MAG: starch-binding protein, partial [Oscillospiraceae bacterium]|nr:starch-binding protein [Candidatus Ruminococcus equi]
MGKECNAYAHYWEDQGESPIQWPGVAMNHVSGNVYSIEIDKKYNKIIFSENGGSKTGDLDIPGDGYIYNKNSGNWSPYGEQPTQHETGSSDFSDPDTLFVCDDGNWGSVYVHYWGSQETQWPGAQMNKVGTYEGSDLYSLKLPSGLSGIVINIGSNAQQSSDLTMPGAYKIFKTSSKSFVDVNQ